jgi:hypothetical protein
VGRLFLGKQDALSEFESSNPRTTVVTGPRVSLALLTAVSFEDFLQRSFELAFRHRGEVMWRGRELVVTTGMICRIGKGRELDVCASSVRLAGAFKVCSGDVFAAAMSFLTHWTLQKQLSESCCTACDRTLVCISW